MEENQSMSPEKKEAPVKDGSMAIKITLVLVIAALLALGLVYILPRIW